MVVVGIVSKCQQMVKFSRGFAGLVMVESQDQIDGQRASKGYGKKASVNANRECVGAAMDDCGK